MQERETNNPWTPLWILAAGLAVAQLLATAQVHFTGSNLYDRLVIIRDAGFLVVPNEKILPTLLEWQPAFWGGLFFTVSIGLAVALISYGLAWIWDRIFHRHRGFLLLVTLLWAGFLAGLNISGLNVFASLYFILIPGAVSILFLKFQPRLTRREVWNRFTAYTLPVVLLAVLWQPKVHDGQFITVRDRLLLSNPVGSRINDFYYKYTLYPAEVFKSLDQKLIRTYTFAGEDQDQYKVMLRNILVPRDYLPVGSQTAADLVIAVSGSDFVFQSGDKAVLTMATNDFHEKPDSFLEEYAAEIDRNLLFRQFIFISILFCLLIVPYILLFNLFGFILDLAAKEKIPLLVRNGLCALLAVVLLVYAFPAQKKIENKEQVVASLTSPEWQQRVAALRYIEEKGLEIGDRNTYEKILASPNAAERYWLAKALGGSRLSSSYDDLIILLKDRQPNVVSMALYGLGQRGEKKSADVVKEHLAASDHWYEQWHGYRALKRLGWQQEGSWQ